MNRCYSTLEIKSVNEEDRIIEGVASTPSPDRVGDIVVPTGAKFSLPFPLLWQHRTSEPIGHVVMANATDAGIPFRAKIVNVKEPGRLKDRLDEAWQSIKHGLVKAVSIGFKPIDYEPIDKKNPFGGLKFNSWEWLELSAVTIPANTEASIHVIRSIDEEFRHAALGIASDTLTLSSGVSDKSESPGVSGKSVKLAKGKKKMKNKIQDQIATWEATLTAKVERRDELLAASGEAGETLDDQQSQEYDELEVEIAKINKHLTRLNTANKTNIEQAAPVESSSNSVIQGGRVVSVSTKANRPPGIGFARMTIAKLHAFKYSKDVGLAARELYPSDPEIEASLKTAVLPGDTTTSTWASQLVVAQNLASEFVEFLRPQTVLGRIPGFRRVPFNVTMPRQTAGSTSTNWVGEGQPKPLGKLAFDNVTLRWAKVAGIVTFTDELARFSSPAVETLVRDDLAAGMAKFLDEQFFDPNVGEVSNVSPASITNGADNAAASGNTITDVIHDVKNAFAELQGAFIPITGCCWVMEPNQAVALSMLQNSLGQPAFPGINVDGGYLYGLPVYTSENVGSQMIVILKPSEIMIADDGGVAIDVSREASLQFSDTPTDTAQSMVSLWQSNMVAVRAERYINWKVRRAHAVYYLTSADYGGVGSA